MPGSTTRMGLPYPLGNETADVAGDIQRLAEAVDTAAETPAGAQAKVDAVQTNLNTHATLTTTAHGATSAATASTLMARDASGRAKIAPPSAADDIARKDTVDAHANRTDNPHGVTPAQIGAVNKAGDTMTGTLTINHPTSASVVIYATNPNGGFRLLGYNDGYDYFQTIQKLKISGIGGAILPEVNIVTSSLLVNGNTVYHTGIKSDIIASGSYADTTTSIAASGTVNINIPIGAGKTRATVHFYAVDSSSGNKNGGIITCSTVSQDTLAYYLYGNSGGIHVNKRDVAGYVTYSDGSGGSVGSCLGILDCYISGTNLVIVVRNTYSGGARTLNINKLHWTAA